jgi:ketosteroid isomerase-like protein
MSQENIEIVRRGFEAGNRRDVEALIEVLDPEVEWHSALLKALEGKAAMYRGHEGIREFFRDLDELFDMLHAEYPEIRDLGDRVVGIGRIRMRGKGSGAETESPICSVVDFKNGKAIRVRTYLDPKEALEAAMLTEQPIPQQHIDITLRQVDAVNRRDAEAFVASRRPISRASAVVGTRTAGSRVPRAGPSAALLRAGTRSSASFGALLRIGENTGSPRSRWWRTGRTGSW